MSLTRFGFSLDELLISLTCDQCEINDLYYTFPVTEKISALVGTNGVDVDDFFNVVPTMGVTYDSLSLFSAYKT